MQKRKGKNKDVKPEKKKEKTKMAKPSVVEPVAEPITDMFEESEVASLAIEEDSIDSIESLASIDKEEEFTDADIGTLEDVSSLTGETEEKRPMGKIRPNPPPKIMWSDRVKTKFKTGDIVNLNGTCATYKVVAPGRDSYTYEVLASGHNVSAIAKEREMALAPQGSTWKTFYQATDPFSIKGLNISCPSNGKLK
jgi:hypothetical protein